VDARKKYAGLSPDCEIQEKVEKEKSARMVRKRSVTRADTAGFHSEASLSATFASAIQIKFVKEKERVKEKRERVVPRRAHAASIRALRARTCVMRHVCNSSAIPLGLRNAIKKFSRRDTAALPANIRAGNGAEIEIPRQ